MFYIPESFYIVILLDLPKQLYECVILYVGTIKFELEEEIRDCAEMWEWMLFREAAWKNLQYLAFTHCL